MAPNSRRFSANYDQLVKEIAQVEFVYDLDRVFRHDNERAFENYLIYTTMKLTVAIALCSVALGFFKPDFFTNHPTIPKAHVVCHFLYTVSVLVEKGFLFRILNGSVLALQVALALSGITLAVMDFI